MRRIRQRSLLFTLAIMSVAIGACTAATQTVSTEQASSAAVSRFSNILVIGVADDYERRTRFERRLASELKASGTAATALYVAAGGNKPIEREAILDLVNSNGYDAVLISKPLNRNTNAEMKTGSAATKTTRRDDGALHLFRYDYEELNEPTTWKLDLSVTLSTELFAAKGSQKVWAVETDVSKKESIEDLINEASEKIVARLKRDRLIRN